MESRLLCLICLCLVAKVYGAAYGEACTADTDCSDVDPLTKCDTGNTGKCICLDTHARDDSACKVKATGTCTGNDVTLCVSNTVCPSGICNCATSYKAAASGLCVMTYDTVCANTGECTSLANSICKDDAGTMKCKCADGYKVDGTTPKTCISVIGDTCTENSKCTDAVSHSECTGTDGAKTCMCMNGYSGATCTVVYNALACGTDNVVCTRVLKYGKCSATKCMCDDTAVVEDNICKRKIDGDCATGDLCPNNAGCTAATCSCNSNYEKENDKCKATNSGMAVMASLMPIITALASVLLR